MERELLVTGIGGQGVQLVAKVIAQAAMTEGREVQLFGSYGGMMRGGSTEATVVVADEAIVAPPTVEAAWSAILLHHEYSASVLDRVRDGGVVLVNATVFEHPLDCSRCEVVEVPAGKMAVELGHSTAASMVMAGAYAAVTGLVGLASLEVAAREALPSYRAQHAERNALALRAGFSACPTRTAPAGVGACTTPAGSSRWIAP